jgi:hypothetical protein
MEIHLQELRTKEAYDLPVPKRPSPLYKLFSSAVLFGAYSFSQLSSSLP